ncbi:hypothetical protein ACFLY6_01905 [Candidatus Dependentiae bacterium]
MEKFSRQKRQGFGLLFIFFVLGVCFALYSLFNWKYGYLPYEKISREIEGKKIKLCDLRCKIIDINYKICEIDKADFEFEKMLREELLMSKPQEKVFYVYDDALSDAASTSVS